MSVRFTTLLIEGVGGPALLDLPAARVPTVGEELEVTLPGGGSSRFRITSVEEMPVLPEDPEHIPDGARRTKYRVFGVAVSEPIEGVYR